MRVSFYEIFEIRDGMVSPKVPVQIGGVTMGPGVAMGGGVSIGGVDIATLAGRDLEVEKTADRAIIKGYY